MCYVVLIRYALSEYPLCMCRKLSILPQAVNRITFDHLYFTVTVEAYYICIKRQAYKSFDYFIFLMQNMIIICMHKVTSLVHHWKFVKL